MILTVQRDSCIRRAVSSSVQGCLTEALAPRRVKSCFRRQAQTCATNQDPPRHAFSRMADNVPTIPLGHCQPGTGGPEAQQGPGGRPAQNGPCATTTAPPKASVITPITETSTVTASPKSDQHDQHRLPHPGEPEMRRSAGPHRGLDRSMVPVSSIRVRSLLLTRNH